MKASQNDPTKKNKIRIEIQNNYDTQGRADSVSSKITQRYFSSHGSQSFVQNSRTVIFQGPGT